MTWTDRKQAAFRWMLKTRAFAGLYGRVIGPASARMFGDILQEQLLPQLPIGAKVLEVGCGPGLQALDLVRRRPDLRITASDFSAAFIALAKRNAARAGQSRTGQAAIEFAVADAMDPSVFPDGTFDAVYSITAIKHFPDPVRGLREFLRVVKPGGTVVVSEIRRESALADVEALANYFVLPARWRKPAARFVHANLREECPPLATVEAWFAETDSLCQWSLRALDGRPAWLATTMRARAAG